ncbi:hypothetical protein OIT44_01160 [Weissella ceti]|uniref:Type II secretion system protein n=1 Tax=Weissella ceti TaxID=759620 RepID=A0ABT3E2N6_9LACO|nr:hypothetical protein [Weissella ceti]MCW0952686.1 hypothetical protein [Weissella ceti]QVK12388.1 hypothetical protein KHQ31_01800 [Weissella ceti]
MFSKRQGFILYEAILGLSVFCLAIQLCMGMLQNCQREMILEETRLASLRSHFERLDSKSNETDKKGQQKRTKVYRTKREILHSKIRVD